MRRRIARLRPASDVRARVGVAIGLSSVLSLGCVSSGSYDRALSDLSEAREESTDHYREAEAFRSESKRLDAELQKIRAEQADLKGANAQLTHQVEDLMLLNAEFAERLKGAGQNVEQLATERGNLREALASTRAEVAAWRKQQQAIAARTAQQQQLVTALQPLIAAKRVDLGVRQGRVLVTMPSDDLFDPGKSNVKATGRPALIQIAKALRALSGRSFRLAAHMDAAQPSSGFSANWQLTAARSLSVARELITAGVPAGQLSVAAYAEYDSVESNDSEPGRVRNRRVEIVLVPLADELVQPMAAAAPVSKPPSVAP